MNVVGAARAGRVFAGVEARWLHAFQGLTFRRQTGRALYVGPTLHWRVSDGAWLSLAWNIQVAGKEEGDPRQLDLTHFSRHAARIKFGMEF